MSQPTAQSGEEEEGDYSSFERNTVSPRNDEQNEEEQVANEKKEEEKEEEEQEVTVREIFSGSKNVARMFLYNLLDQSCTGVWSMSVLPVFMFLLEGSNAFVGYNAAVQGGCQMLSAILAAYIGDKRIWPKFYLLRLASVCGVFAIVVTVFAVHARNAAVFWPSSALWGLYMGLSYSTSESLFADSVPDGHRVSVYTYKWIVQLLALCIGYGTTVWMFAEYGNKWRLQEMTPILYAGLFAHASAMISLWLMHDDFALEVNTTSASNDEDENENNKRSEKNSSANEKGKSSSSSSSGVNATSAAAAASGGSNPHLKITKTPSAITSSGSTATVGAIGSIQTNEDEIESINQQRQQKKLERERSQKEQAKEKETKKRKVVDEEHEKEVVEELEDDLKREKTGDPFLVDICPVCCFCCCNMPHHNNHHQGKRSTKRMQKEQQVLFDDDDDNLDNPRSATSSNNNNNLTGESAKLLDADNSNNIYNSYSGNNNNQTAESEQGEEETSTEFSLCAKMTLVPILICSGDIFQALGGGVTVRFFPLFFSHDLDVSPMTLAVAWIILTIFAAFFSNLLKKFSSKFRRPTLIVIIRVCGAGTMFLLQFASGAIGSKYPMLVYWVMRSAFLNCLQGMSRSILMDFCRKRHRTFFSAMESVAVMSFSGTAAIGGVLADKFGYRSTFAVTAGFYIAAALAVLPASKYVDQKLENKDEDEQEKKDGVEKKEA